MKLNELVYGESVEALRPGILTIGDNMKPAKDDSVHFSVRLEPERGNAVRRAIGFRGVVVVQLKCLGVVPPGSKKRSGWRPRL